MTNPERFSYVFILIGAHTQNMNPDKSRILKIMNVE